jgi:hypothetical protein
MECVSTGSPLNGSYSPTATFNQFQRSGNNSATSSPALSARTTLDSTIPNSPGIHEPTSASARLHHKKSVPSIDGGGIMSIDHVRQVSLSERGQDADISIAPSLSAKTDRLELSPSVIVHQQEQSSIKSSRNSTSQTIQVIGVSS